MSNSKDIPVLFSKKEKCCGCGACFNICPVGAIAMKEDQCGFRYPAIDEETCIRCGSCKRVCAFQNSTEENNVMDTYAAVAKDRDIRLKSASGGIFTAIANMYMDKDGVVYGAAFDEHWNVCHIGVENRTEIGRLQGSKYIQSDTGTTFQSVREVLSQGREVLYSGTPCQIAGLKSFLGKRYDNLLTIDLVCHGVPSNRMFRDYLGMLEEKEGGVVTEFLFRDKEIGWGKNGKVCILCHGKDRERKLWQSASAYLFYFSNGWIFRESCYKCPYACGHRPADLTIGDYWGIEREHPDYVGKKGWNEEEGVSLVLVNTEEGRKCLNQSAKYVEVRRSDFEKASHFNARLRKSSEKGKRDELLRLYIENGWKALDKKHEKNIGLRKYSSQIKMLIPPGLKRKLKSRIGV